MHAGTRISHYEILGPLGRGGMGEVWRARDSKLKREVALKTLPPELASDAERLARLEREATLLAALNHPNIASIHGIEEQDGARFLVLELIEGRTLADRLAARPLAVKESLEIALQIAAALEAAHEKGVIHRDLKPANIKITPEGRVKVLDFGLAKTLARSAGGGAMETAVGTELGVVMGTAPYMSPEQARGESAGRPTDIWSFGVVLYEMLTGISPFERDTGAQTIARVLEVEPDYAALPPATPASARRLIRRCLEKDVRRRFRDMGDVRIEVEDALAAEPATAAPAARRGGVLGRAAAGLALVALIALAGFGVTSLIGRPAPDREVVRLSIASLPPRGSSAIGAEHLALSPDGTRFAYASQSGLLIRRLGEEEFITVESVGAATHPFFSPDGEWVGFYDGEFKKIPSAGGAPVVIAATNERTVGATWGSDDTIVFATTSGLYAVAANGGAARLLVRPDPARGERQYAWPRFLPDGRAVLFTIVPQGSIDTAQIALFDLETLETRVLLTGGTAAHYTPTGHLVYTAGQALMAIGFDAATRETIGAPVPLRGVAVATERDTGAAELAISATGTLALIAPNVLAPPSLRTLVWVDRTGNEEALALAPAVYVYPRISPDGTRIAVDIDGVNRDIWIWDNGRESLSRLTDNPSEEMLALWAPDGRRVFFASDRAGNFDIYSQPPDGSTAARVELADPKFHAPHSFSPDGTQLIVGEEFRDLSVLDLTSGAARPLLHREAIDWHGEVSPDGHWFAYESDESGQFEIYLRPFPDVEGRREKVSIDGGRYVLWGRPGSGEIYYVDLAGAMMAVPVQLSPTLTVGRPTKLFDFLPPGPGGASGNIYDVSPLDGRFLKVKTVSQPVAEAIDVTVILNWFAELREQVPTP